jgi:hypothetical protein
VPGKISLPSITSDIPRDLRNFLDRVRDILTSTGEDRLVRKGEMIDDAPAGDSRVPTPSNFRIEPKEAQLRLTWQGYSYPEYSYTEIWRGDTPSFQGADALGVSPGGSYVDTVMERKSYFYWVRFVNKDGAKGPFTGANRSTKSGLQRPDVAGAEALPDPITLRSIMDALTQEIIDTRLYQNLIKPMNDEFKMRMAEVRDRIEEVKTDANLVIGEVSSSAEAGIWREEQARIGADTAIVTSVEVLGAKVDTNTADILTEKQLRIDGDGALASQLTALDTKFETSEASILQELTAVSTATSANASAVQSLSTTVGGYSTTISSHTTSINGLNAEYTLKIDNNGKVAGFGLASETNTAGTTSYFQVAADRFAVITSGTPTSANIPFIVSGSTTYIKSAAIQDASIGNAKITNAAITNAKIADAAITSAKIQDAQITTAKIGLAQVDTLRIGADAVTTFGEFSGYTGWLYLVAGTKVAFFVPPGASTWDGEALNYYGVGIFNSTYRSPSCTLYNLAYWEYLKYLGSGTGFWTAPSSGNYWFHGSTGRFNPAATCDYGLKINYLIARR